MLFDAHRLESPRVVTRADTHVARAATLGAGLEFFWKEYYFPKGELPTFLGGHQRRRIKHMHLGSNGAVSPVRTVYEARGDVDGAWDFVAVPRSMGQGCDLVMLLKTASMRDKLAHVADVLSASPPPPFSIAACTEPMSHMTFCAGRAGSALEVLWSEDRNAQQETRLVERRLSGAKWSAPNLLASWPLDELGPELGLTCCAVPDQKEMLVALWSAPEDNRLTYAIRQTDGQWTGVRTCDLLIGGSNWLVRCGDKLVLVTRMRGNQVWAFLRVMDD